jgi:hypothetical protein
LRERLNWRDLDEPEKAIMAVCRCQAFGFLVKSVAELSICRHDFDGAANGKNAARAIAARRGKLAGRQSALPPIDLAD